MSKRLYSVRRRDQRACPEQRDSADRRFFGARFPGVRLCCGPAAASAQVLVAQNALPPAPVLGYFVLPTARRRKKNSGLNGAQKYQIWRFIREVPQGAIGVSLAENAETLGRWTATRMDTQGEETR